MVVKAITDDAPGEPPGPNTSTIKDVPFDFPMPPIIDGDQIIREGNDVMVVRNGHIIWHKAGDKFILWI